MEGIIIDEVQKLVYGKISSIPREKSIKYLRPIRENLGISQRDLATKAFVTNTCIYKIEKKIMKPSHDTWESIKDALIDEADAVVDRLRAIAEVRIR